MKSKKVAYFFLFVATVSVISLFATNKIYSNVLPINTDSSNTVEELIPVKKELVVPQQLIDIGWCESTNDQSKVGLNYVYESITLEDGTKKRVRTDVVWSRDIGKYQINDYFHEETAKKLGFDIYTEEGNTAYALLLYNKNGTSDWNASKACWVDVEAWKAKHKQPFYK